VTRAQLRVAIVHERFTEWAGSERVVEQLHSLWPEAPIHAAVVDRSVLPTTLRDADVRPTGLQRLYRGGTQYAHLLPLLPAAFRRIDLRGVDLVLTSHHAFANRVRAPHAIPVVSYVHAASRWIWDPAERAGEIGGQAGRVGLTLFAATQRRPDRAAASRLRGAIANSTYTAGKVREYWLRDPEVVPPPVDVTWLTPNEDVVREGFFLFVGRLVPVKRADLAIAAANRAGVPLVVVGDGRLRHQLEAAAGSTVEFVGAGDRPMLLDLYRRCRAVVFPGVEPFGIVPVEAQACGAPVIARAAGGALESILEGKTGTLFDPESSNEVEALAQALRDFDGRTFDARVIRDHAVTFSAEHFRERFTATLAGLLENGADER
jgi:glycosyltransferase involved in cell wall biosynthesis